MKDNLWRIVFRETTLIQVMAFFCWRHQSITWINAGCLVNLIITTVYQWDFIEIFEYVMQENASENVSEIIFWPRTPQRAKTCHYSDVITSALASQITRLAIVYLNVYSGADQRKYQNSASLAFVRGIHRWPANSLPKGLVKRKIFPFDDDIMCIPIQLIHQ